MTRWPLALGWTPSGPHTAYGLPVLALDASPNLAFALAMTDSIAPYTSAKATPCCWATSRSMSRRAASVLLYASAVTGRANVSVSTMPGDPTTIRWTPAALSDSTIAVCRWR